MAESEFSPKFAPFFGMVSWLSKLLASTLTTSPGWHRIRHDIRLYGVP